MAVYNLHTHFFEAISELWEEAVDPANFPSDGFIARCCLIA